MDIVVYTLLVQGLGCQSSIVQVQEIFDGFEAESFGQTILRGAPYVSGRYCMYGCHSEAAPFALSIISSKQSRCRLSISAPASFLSWLKA